MPSGDPQTLYPNALAAPRPCAPAAPAAWWLPVVLLAACAAPRLAMAARLDVLCGDAATYVRCAKQIEQGDLAGGFGLTGPTPFTVGLAALHRLGLDWETAGKLWSLAMATLAVLPLWGWVRRRYGQRVALAAAFLYIVHPKLIEWSPEIIRDPTFWLLAATAVYALWRAVAEVRIAWFLAAGCVGTLAAFTRVEGWFLAILLVCWTAWRWWSLETARWRLVTGVVLCLAVCPAAVIVLQHTWLRGLPEASWGEAGRLARVTAWWQGVWRPAPPALATAAAASVGPPPEAAAPPALARTDRPVLPPASAAPSPERLSRGEAVWLFVHTMRRGLDAVFALLLFGGLWRWRRLWWRSDNRPLFYVALCVLASVWVHLSLAQQSSSRYALSIVILGCPFAALALLGLCDGLARMAGRLGARGRVAALAAIGLPLAVGALGIGDALHGEEPFRQSDAALGRWLARELGPGRKFAALGGLSIVVHYADAALPVCLTWDRSEAVLRGIEAFEPDVLLIERTADEARTQAILQQAQSWGLGPLAPRHGPPPLRGPAVLVLVRNPLLETAQRDTAPAKAPR